MPHDPRRPNPRAWSAVALALVAIPLLGPGCTRVSDANRANAPGDDATAEPVTLYCALDREYAEAIVADFRAQTGIEVRFVADDELTKTTGLVNRLIASRERPECDVFWNNEIAQTLRLVAAGLTQPYDSPSAADIPAQWKDASHHWTGFAARARVILYNTERIANAADAPRSLDDLIDPKWRGRAALAKPLFGTTATHGAALFAAWGKKRAQEFFQACLDNDVAVLTSNGACMKAVAAGELDWCFTDTDDARVAIEQGKPVAVVYPDQGEGERGTLVLPNTIALIAGAPNAAGGKRLIDFVLSRAVERQLAEARSAQIPVRASVPAPAHVRRLPSIRRMDVTWEAIAAAFDDAYAWFTAHFIRD